MGKGVAKRVHQKLKLGGMKIEQHVLNRTFFVKVGGRTYEVDYLNSDGHTYALSNRNYWEIFDEDKEDADLDLELEEALLKLCIEHFDDYNPIRDEKRKPKSPR